MIQFIDLKRQYQLIDKNIIASIQKVLEHGQYILGPEVAELEKKLATFVGVKHVIANSSGTDALLIALMALDIQPGDEVVTSPFSFFATAEVIALCHAIPVFVDIDPDTYNLDPAKLEQAITKKTKAIIPVSLYGQCADMDAINSIANKYHLPVIEDAAQSFGATYKNRSSGSLSTIACTSFFPSKPLGGYGDSGACFTNDDAIAEKLRVLCIHGQKARYDHHYVGINGRMDTIQAAILLEKLKCFPNEVVLRQRVAMRYNQLLADFCKTPIIKKHQNSVYAQYTIEVDNRRYVQETLASLGIPTAVHYPIALHCQPALSHLNYQLGDFPVSEAASRRVISLPMHPYLKESEQVQIAHALAKTQAVNLEVA